MAFFDDRGRWPRWFAEARPRLLASAEGVAAAARQALDLATPYRFRSLGRQHGMRASTCGLSSAGRPR